MVRYVKWTRLFVLKNRPANIESVLLYLPLHFDWFLDLGLGVGPYLMGMLQNLSYFI